MSLKYVKLSASLIMLFYKNQSNAWDAWQWRKYMWLAIDDGAIILGVSLYEDMTKLISVRGRTLQLQHRLLNHF